MYLSGIVQFYTKIKNYVTFSYENPVYKYKSKKSLTLNHSCF